MIKAKAKYSLLFILLFSLFFETTLYANQRLVTFGIDSDFPPFSFVANNTAQGFENDLMKLIFENTDYNLDFKYGLP